MRSPYPELKHLFGETMWRVLNGEDFYHLFKADWKRLFGELCPYTKEEWEREIKDKSLFDLLPKEKWSNEY